jgi:hypothetical protein
MEHRAPKTKGIIMEHKGSQNNAEEQFVIYILPLLAFHTETWALIDRNKAKSLNWISNV